MGWVGQASLLTAALLLAGGYVGVPRSSRSLERPATRSRQSERSSAAPCSGSRRACLRRRLHGIYLLLGTLGIHFVVDRRRESRCRRRDRHAGRVFPNGRVAVRLARSTATPNGSGSRPWRSARLPVLPLSRADSRRPRLAVIKGITGRQASPESGRPIQDARLHADVRRDRRRRDVPRAPHPQRLV